MFANLVKSSYIQNFMDETNGTFLADIVYFSVILGLGVISVKFLSKVLKAAITREAMKSAAKANPENDYPEGLDFE